MAYNRLIWLCCFILGCVPASSILLVVPEDVPAGFAAIFGFTPRILKGNDHRFGFGFSLGPHADFQVLYELGPQLRTKPLQQVKVRSANYRKRVVRWPVINLLLNLGVLKQPTYDVNEGNELDCEPR